MRLIQLLAVGVLLGMTLALIVLCSGCSYELTVDRPWYGEDGDPAANARADFQAHVLEQEARDLSQAYRTIAAETSRAFGADAVAGSIWFGPPSSPVHAQWDVQVGANTYRMTWLDSGLIYTFRLPEVR